jgi:ribosomal protein S18 acetylase RimI-like enzyme
MRPRSPARPEPRFVRYYRDLVSFPLDAVGAWRREGLIGVRIELRHRTLNRVYRRWYHVVVEGSLELEPPAPDPPPGIEIGPLTEDAWPHVLALADSRGRPKLQELRDQNQTCLIARRGSAVVGYIWIATPGTADNLLPGVELPHEGVFFHFLYVSRPERRQGIASSMHLAAGRLARQLGYRYIWAATEMANRAALRSVIRTRQTPRVMTQTVGTMELKSLLGRLSMRVTRDPAYQGPLPRCFP